ncbi:hypothetical protein HG536_0B02250 [Torulaspora globosa]|uniref:HMG box domain-containing protein n=1 Tax=Torulaspora globosa TaxID=48254 RepID=A0A7G3ZCX6_9SACH|nr:uncharacterized protein HG536_0B02250 [Torulaspora globosa]QLL31362.1 hypothetical protein HG536_0B02250 [Torulaspora globosa]
MDDSPREMGRYGEKEKIPRPRNAFILFRQHNHKLLIDEWTTKGLEIPHNSKISKLLGVKWKELSNEEKVHWKELAEKEKTDHEKKYPDYRYKPVRKQRKKKEPVPLAAPPQQPPQQQYHPQHQHQHQHQHHPPIAHRPAPGLLPFNNYTRPQLNEQHHVEAAYRGVYPAPYYWPPYYMQQAYPYNYYAKTPNAPANPQVYPAPIPFQTPMQMPVQQRKPSHEIPVNRDQVPDFSYYSAYQHQQHRPWNAPQPANPKPHPIVSSTPVVHDYQNSINHPSPSQSQDSNSH